MATPPASRDLRRRRFAALLERYLVDRGPLPQVVKITGTSGKGSVTAMLEAALLRDGQSTGAFTSPHLVNATERIRIRGADITPGALRARNCSMAPLFDAAAKEWGEDFRPSFFEAMLLIALDEFREQGVQVALLEAAIGGYYDVVSLIPAAVSCITSVGLDHTEELGATFDAIASDKAGIASDRSILVLGPSLTETARQAIRLDARRREVRILETSLAGIESRSLGLDGHAVHLTEPEASSFHLPLAGDFQIENLATALGVLQFLPHKSESIAGMERTRWPARLEYFPGTPAFLVDAAHNALAFRALRRFLLDLHDPRRRTLLLGVTDPEKHAEAVAELAPLFDDVSLVEGFHRAAHVGDAFPSPVEALGAIMRRSEAGMSLVVIAGSVFLAGACRNFLIERTHAKG